MDVGAIAGINAVVLTVLIGGALAYAALLRQGLETDEARAFELADAITELRGARSSSRAALARLGKRDPIDVVREALGPGQGDAAEDGKAVLALLSLILSSPPLGSPDRGSPVPATFGELHSWSEAVRQRVAQAQIAVHLHEERFRDVAAAFEQDQAERFPASSWDGFARSILDDLREAGAIARRVSTQTRLTQQKRDRIPRRLWMVALCLGGCTFVIGVILPLVWNGVPKSLVAWEPSAFYLLLLATGIWRVGTPSWSARTSSTAGR